MLYYAARRLEPERVSESLMQREISGIQYFSTAAVLSRTDVSRQTLWRWRREGRIPAGHRFRNGQVLFTLDELQEILAYANRIEPNEIVTACAATSVKGSS